MALTFEHVFKVPLKAMKISRALPDSKIDFKWFLNFLIIYGGYAMYLLTLLYNMFFINSKAKDITQAAKNGIVCVVIVSDYFQYAILLWNKKFLTSLFNKVKSDYMEAKNLSYEDQKVVIKFAQQSVWIGKMWLVVSIGGNVTPLVKNVILHIYYCCVGDCHLIHLYDFVYPKIINDRKEQVVIFSILYLLFFLYSSYCGVIYCSFSPLGPNFMLHACGQLEIVTKRIENLFSENVSVQDIMNELKSVAIELQRINDFVEEIKDTFKVAYEIVLKVTSILLPITVYEVTEAFGEGELSVEFLVFTFGSLIVAASPCYYSELLMEKGEMFRMALYCCGWERTYDRRTRTMILLLLQRASRTLAIRTIFKTVCLDTLTDFCRQSYTIFSLINAMWN